MKKKVEDKKKIYVQTNYGLHLCILEPDDNRGYIVTVPGLTGVVTWGKSISHAKEMAQEAIELCVECLVGDMARVKDKAMSV